MNIAKDTLKNEELESKALALAESIAPVQLLLENAKAPKEVDPFRNVDKFFANLKFGAVKSETDYWTNLIPKDDAEMFARWVFAIMSVHTTWESNVRGYEIAMSDLSWTLSKDKLKQMVVKARVGLYERRERGLWDLVTKFRENPDQFKKQDDETWQECRNRLIGTIYGLGNAKTTYALSLSYPTESQLCCLDVHLLRFMGHDLSNGHASSLKVYEKMENEWLARCNKYGISANVAREMYWNKVQGRRNSRYWSYCLEA
jgi:hypothetical protein|tara:strand:+ start:356 stop:1132 length:777 start_codon:yes stop_codon:yes gene_type:complete